MISSPGAATAHAFDSSLFRNDLCRNLIDHARLFIFRNSRRVNAHAPYLMSAVRPPLRRERPGTSFSRRRAHTCALPITETPSPPRGVPQAGHDHLDGIVFGDNFVGRTGPTDRVRASAFGPAVRCRQGLAMTPTRLVPTSTPMQIRRLTGPRSRTNRISAAGMPSGFVPPPWAISSAKPPPPPPMYPPAARTSAPALTGGLTGTLVRRDDQGRFTADETGKRYDGTALVAHAVTNVQNQRTQCVSRRHLTNGRGDEADLARAREAAAGFTAAAQRLLGTDLVQFLLSDSRSLMSRDSIRSGSSSARPPTS